MKKILATVATLAITSVATTASATTSYLVAWRPMPYGIQIMNKRDNQVLSLARTSKGCVEAGQSYQHVRSALEHSSETLIIAQFRNICMFNGQRYIDVWFRTPQEVVHTTYQVLR